MPAENPLGSRLRRDQKLPGPTRGRDRTKIAEFLADERCSQPSKTRAATQQVRHTKESTKKKKKKKERRQEPAGLLCTLHRPSASASPASTTSSSSSSLSQLSSTGGAACKLKHCSYSLLSPTTTGPKTTSFSIALSLWNRPLRPRSSCLASTRTTTGRMLRPLLPSTLWSQGLPLGYHVRFPLSLRCFISF